MSEEQEHLSELLAAENGKPIRQTREEIAAAIRIFRGFGEESKRIFGRQIPLDAVPGLERHLALTMREPLGVVAAIVPFNYPVELYAHKAAAALAAGNAVIAKPPSKCPLTLLRIAELIEEAGAPPAAHQALVGGHEIVELLAATDGVQMVTFTGGTDAGIAIARLAAGTLKRVDLELGGNDAMIVCADADLAKAAEAVVLGRLARGNGQICCAVKRVFVEETVYEPIRGDPGKARAGARRGRPARGGHGRRAADRRGGGAKRRRRDRGDGRERWPGRRRRRPQGRVRRTDGDHRRSATRGVDRARRSSARSHRCFASRLPSEAVALANDSPYGLQASIFTRDLEKALRLARALEVGGVVVNGSSALRAENLPFGGVKLTGGDARGHPRHAPRHDEAEGGDRDGGVRTVMLELTGIHKSYGRTRVLHGVDLAADPRRGPRAVRRERGGQDDADQDRLGSV